jgi:MerR family copper efflux transcriptional regulator
MVKGRWMLISDFARRAGLSRDTVRYYVRAGLLRPEVGAKGGRNPYQIFTAEHLLAAKVIRTSQALGMSLKEIAAMSEERRAGRNSVVKSVAILRAQRDRLADQEAQLQAMKAYLDAKIGWLRRGQKGPPPDFDVFISAGSGRTPAAAPPPPRRRRRA